MEIETKGERAARMNSMDSVAYTAAHGGTLSKFMDSDNGLNQTTPRVFTYYNKLRGYTLNRYTWHSSIISPWDLQLIEHLIFHRGHCALVMPVIAAPNLELRLRIPRVFEANIIRQNLRTGEPIAVNVLNRNATPARPIKPMYGPGEFAMLTDQYTLLPTFNTPMHNHAWEYANKLHEVDLAFNANSHKQRIPMLFNNGVSKDVAYDTQLNKTFYNQGHFTISKVVSEAMRRNEQFVEIPQGRKGNEGVLYQTNQFNENNLLDYIQAQRRLYDEYFELIGVEIIHEKHGAYQARDVQLMSVSSNNYKSTEGLRNRRFFAERVNEVLGTDLTVRLLNYQGSPGMNPGNGVAPFGVMNG